MNLKNIKICNLHLKYFIPFFIILLISVYTDNLNSDLVGTCIFLYMFGGLFSFLGKRIPILGKWVGGDILLPLFGGSLLVYFNLIPESIINQVTTFINSGFVNFFLSAVIVGAILGIDRSVLLKLYIRFIPCMLGAIACVIGSVFLASYISGLPFLKGVYMIGLPNFCGGSTGSLVAVPAIYEKIIGGSVLSYAGKFIILLNISNIISILFAGILNLIGKKYPKLTGNGKLIENQDLNNEKEESNESFKYIHYLGIGCAVSWIFMVMGKLISTVLPFLNYIAWVAIIVVLVKVFNLADKEICTGSQSWQKLMMIDFLPGLLVGVGISSIDISEIFSVFSLVNVFIISAGVLGGVIGSGLLALVFKLHPIDTMIAIGCNLGNIGGTGALAVLSSTNRMELIPFATIANRIGGAVMLIIISITVVCFL